MPGLRGLFQVIGDGVTSHHPGDVFELANDLEIELVVELDGPVVVLSDCEHHGPCVEEYFGEHPLAESLSLVFWSDSEASQVDEIPLESNQCVAAQVSFLGLYDETGTYLDLVGDGALVEGVVEEDHLELCYPLGVVCRG